MLKSKQSALLGWVGVAALMVGMQSVVNHNLITGDPPAISGPSLDGRHFDLAQLHGKPAVIYFWASWCPVCRGMQGSIQQIAKDFPAITVAMQSGNSAEVARYMSESDFVAPTLTDDSGEIAKRYGLTGVPAVFVLGPEGKIRYATMGFTTEIGLRLRLWLASR